MKKTPKQIVAAVREKAAKVTAWADLSNFVFDPEVGILSGIYKTEAERRAFAKTPEYKEIRRIIEEVQDRTGFDEGMTPKKSGKFVVRLPRSLHAALEVEAEREGVSLNQLVVAKLSLQLGYSLAFDRELERRIDDIKSGGAKGIPAEEVFAKMREKAH